MFVQIWWGSIVLGLCAAIHIVCIVGWIEILKKHARRFTGNDGFFRVFLPISGTFLALILSHTMQVWIWAMCYVWLHAIPSISEAIYFSLVTYTTVGYGDVILPEEHKIFGAMEAVTGLLNFGVSTAVLVSVISKVLPKQFHN